MNSRFNAHILLIFCRSTNEFMRMAHHIVRSMGIYEALHQSNRTDSAIIISRHRFSIISRVCASMGCIGLTWIDYNTKRAKSMTTKLRRHKKVSHRVIVDAVEFMRAHETFVCIFESARVNRMTVIWNVAMRDDSTSDGMKKYSRRDDSDVNVKIELKSSETIFLDEQKNMSSIVALAREPNRQRLHFLLLK